jgi:hypothetical protein
MALVAESKVRNVTPVAYEFNIRARLSEDISGAGTQLVYTGVITDGVPVMSKAPTTGITEADGISLEKGSAGDVIDVGISGELDGFTGMTPGAKLYPSTTSAGRLDTTAIANAVVRVKAHSATRIRFHYV